MKRGPQASGDGTPAPRSGAERRKSSRSRGATARWERARAAR